MGIYVADLNLHLDQPAIPGAIPGRVLQYSEECPIDPAEWPAMRAAAASGLAALDAYMTAGAPERATWWNAKPTAIREWARVTLLRWA